jgi:hypothetical protein
VSNFNGQIEFDVETLEPGLVEMYEQGRGGQRQSYYQRIIRVEGSKKAAEHIKNYATLGPLTQMTHGGNVPSDTFVTGYKTNFVHKKYGKIIGIDIESWEDDQYDVVRKAPKMLGRSVELTKEQVAHAPFNLAFTGTGLALSDGVTLVSASHPLTKVGGVTSNVLGTARDPGYLAYLELLEMLHTQLDAAGQPLIFADLPKIWLVNPAFAQEAWQAVQSTTAMVVASLGTNTLNSNSAIPNPGKNYGPVTVIADPFFTDTNASLMFVTPDNLEAVMYIRKETGLRVYEKENPEVIFAQTTLRTSAGFHDWRGVAGTPGT